MQTVLPLKHARLWVSDRDCVSSSDQITSVALNIEPENSEMGNAFLIDWLSLQIQVAILGKEESDMKVMLLLIFCKGLLDKPNFYHRCTSEAEFDCAIASYYL